MKLEHSHGDWHHAQKFSHPQRDWWSSDEKGESPQELLWCNQCKKIWFNYSKCWSRKCFPSDLFCLQINSTWSYYYCIIIFQESLVKNRCTDDKPVTAFTRSPPYSRPIFHGRSQPVVLEAGWETYAFLYRFSYCLSHGCGMYFSLPGEYFFNFAQFESKEKTMTCRKMTVQSFRGVFLMHRNQPSQLLHAHSRL